MLYLKNKKGASVQRLIPFHLWNGIILCFDRIYGKPLLLVRMFPDSNLTDKEFVTANYRRFKHLFYSKHEKKPRPIKGLEGMYSLKRLSEVI
jgi:hypothetical protein